MMNKKRICLLGSILAICLIAVITVKFEKGFEKQEINVSGIIAAKTEDELILDSDLIIKGKVKRILKSKWSNEGLARGKDIRNILQTDIVIHVDEVLEGSLNKNSVIVRINKGEDEKTIVHSDGYPDFCVDENVLLFLSRDDSDVKTDEDYYVLTGMRQGKYELNKLSTLTTEKTDIYVNDRGEMNITELKDNISKVKKENPNYKEEKIKKKEEIRKNNIELFGE